MIMMAGIFISRVAVVAAGVMIVVAVGVIFFFFEKQCWSVTEVGG